MEQGDERWPEQDRAPGDADRQAREHPLHAAELPARDGRVLANPAGHHRQQYLRAELRDGAQRRGDQHRGEGEATELDVRDRALQHQHFAAAGEEIGAGRQDDPATELDDPPGDGRIPGELHARAGELRGDGVGRRGRDRASHQRPGGGLLERPGHGDDEPDHFGNDGHQRRQAKVDPAGHDRQSGVCETAKQHGHRAEQQQRRELWVPVDPGDRKGHGGGQQIEHAAADRLDGEGGAEEALIRAVAVLHDVHADAQVGDHLQAHQDRRDDRHRAQRGGVQKQLGQDDARDESQRGLHAVAGDRPGAAAQGLPRLLRPPQVHHLAQGAGHTGARAGGRGGEFGHERRFWRLVDCRAPRTRRGPIRGEFIGRAATSVNGLDPAGAVTEAAAANMPQAAIARTGCRPARKAEFAP